MFQKLFSIVCRKATTFSFIKDFRVLCQTFWHPLTIFLRLKFKEQFQF